MPDESGAAGADRETDPDFLATFRDPGEQQVGEVDAGKEQDERADHREQTGESEDGIPDIRNEQPRRHQEHAPPGVLFRMLFGHFHGDAVQLRLRLLDRDAGLKPSDDKEIVALARIEPGAARLDLFRHHQRNPELRRERNLRPDKTGWRDADDREAMSVEQNSFADDGGITSETLLPAGVTDDHDRVRAGCSIFLWQKAAPQRRFHTEDIEVIPRNIVTPGALVHAVVAQAGDDKAIGEQAGEDGVAVAVVLVVQVRLESEIGPIAQLPVDRDQLRRLAHRQRSKQHRIDQAEDRGVRANPERHGKNSQRGKAGMLQQLAPAIANVLSQCTHPTN